MRGGHLPTGGEGFLYHHDLHPPDEVRVFPVPRSGLRRWDDEAFVYDVVLGGLALRHYSFYGRWFAANCTLYPGGGFATEPGPIDWCFNCDVTSPLSSVGGDLYGVDLCLDVLVGPDGRTHAVKDEDDLARAIGSGWLLPDEEVGARRGLDELLGIIRGPGLVPFLKGVYPFGGAEAAPAAPQMAALEVAAVPRLHRDVRGNYFGQRL